VRAVGVDVDRLLEGGLCLPAAGVDREDVVVLAPTEFVDVTGVEHVGHGVHHEVVLLLGRETSFSAELGRDVALLQ